MNRWTFSNMQSPIERDRSVPRNAMNRSVVYFPAMDYFYCGVVSAWHLDDALGAACGRQASTLCYDCGTSLCQFHTAACDLCKEKFCPSCLSFHLDEHAKPFATDHRQAGKKKTA